MSQQPNYCLSIVITTLSLSDGIRHCEAIKPALYSFSDFEVVIVYLHEDTMPSSTDSLVLIKQKSEGLYSAMNLGFLESTKDWVYFSNIDDVVIEFPSSLDRRFALESYPVCVLSSDGSPLHLRSPSKRYLMPPHQGTFYNRRFVIAERSTPYDDSLRYSGDLDLFLRLRGRSRMHFHPVVSYFKLGGVSNRRSLYLKRKLERAKVLMRYYGVFFACYKTFFK